VQLYVAINYGFSPKLYYTFSLTSPVIVSRYFLIIPSNKLVCVSEKNQINIQIDGIYFERESVVICMKSFLKGQMNSVKDHKISIYESHENFTHTFMKTIFQVSV